MFDMKMSTVTSLTFVPFNAPLLVVFVSNTVNQGFILSKPELKLCKDKQGGVVSLKQSMYNHSIQF